MRYELIIDEAGGTARLEAGGSVIWESNGEPWSRKDPDLLQSILEDANFGQPQKDALRALMGLMDESVENLNNP